MLHQLCEARQSLAWPQSADPAGGNIPAEKPFLRRVMQATQGVVTNQAVKSPQLGGRHLRVVEQRSDRMQSSFAVAQPAKRLDACYAASGGVNERLEAGKGLP